MSNCESGHIGGTMPLCLPKLHTAGITNEALARLTMRQMYEDRFGTGRIQTGNDVLADALRGHRLSPDTVITRGNIDTVISNIHPNPTLARAGWESHHAAAARSVFLASIPDKEERNRMRMKFDIFENRIADACVYFYKNSEPVSNAKEGMEAIGRGKRLGDVSAHPVISLHTLDTRGSARDVLETESFQHGKIADMTHPEVAVPATFFQLHWELDVARLNPDSEDIRLLLSFISDADVQQTVRQYYALRYQLARADQEIYTTQFEPDPAVRQQRITTARFEKLTAFAAAHDLPLPSRCVFDDLELLLQNPDHRSVFLNACNGTPMSSACTDSFSDAHSVVAWLKDASSRREEKPKKLVAAIEAFLHTSTLFDVPAPYVFLPPSDEIVSAYETFGYSDVSVRLISTVAQHLYQTFLRPTLADFMLVVDGVMKHRIAYAAYESDMPITATVPVDDLLSVAGVSGRTLGSIDRDVKAAWYAVGGDVNNTLQVSCPLVSRRKFVFPDAGAQQNRPAPSLIDDAIRGHRDVPYGLALLFKSAGPSTNYLYQLLSAGTTDSIFGIDNYENPAVGTHAMHASLAKSTCSILFPPQHRTWVPDWVIRVKKGSVDPDLILGAASGLLQLHEHLMRLGIDHRRFYAALCALAGEPGLDNTRGVGLASPRGATVSSVPYDVVRPLASDDFLTRAMDAFLQTPFLDMPPLVHDVGSFSSLLDAFTSDHVRAWLLCLNASGIPPDTLVSCLHDPENQLFLTDGVAERFSGISSRIQSISSALAQIQDDISRIGKSVSTLETVAGWCRGNNSEGDQQLLDAIRDLYPAADSLSDDALRSSLSTASPELSACIKRDCLMRINGHTQALHACRKQADALQGILTGTDAEGALHVGLHHHQHAMLAQLLYDLGLRALDVRFAQ